MFDLGFCHWILPNQPTQERAWKRGWDSTKTTRLLALGFRQMIVDSGFALEKSRAPNL